MLSYTLADGLGSVSTSVSTSTGQVSATQLYGPYGAVRYQSGTLPTSKGFTGQRSDATTSGLDYYGARYYDPVVGQFTSADTLLPKSVALPDPQQSNRYTYVGGNPETKTDTTGHCPWCVIAFTAVGVAVAVATIVQASNSGNLTAGTIMRATADVALGVGAGVALSADPIGGTIGLGGAVAGVLIQSKVSGKFDYQSAFDSVAAGTITGAAGGAAFDWVAGYGEASVAATGSFGKVIVQGAVQGGISAISDLNLQLLSHANDLATGRQVNIDWGEVGVAGVTGSLSGFTGGLVRHIGISAPPTAMGGAASFASSVAIGAYAGQQQVSQPYIQPYGTGYRTGGRGILA